MHVATAPSPAAHTLPPRPGPTAEQALLVAVLLNAAFLAVEAVAAWWTGSLALWSDAGHMVADVWALALALVAARIRNRRPSVSYTFALRRAPVLGSLANAVTLNVAVILIVLEAVERLAAPPPIEGWPVLITGVAGLGVNVGSAWYLARSADRSVNTRGAMLHLFADALGSVAAIVAAVAMMGWGAALADPIASLVIAVMVLVGAVPLLRETVGILLQRAPPGLDVDAVRATLQADERVAEVQDLHIWGLDSGDVVMTAVLTVDAHTLAQAEAIADALRVGLAERFAIRHATLECRLGPVDAGVVAV